MKTLLILLLLPVAATSQIRTDTILLNDIYGEYRMNTAPGTAGKVTGVTMFCGPSNPGSQPKIRLNCSTNITSNALQPLYVINDCIVDNFELNSINPSDIESISIFKNSTAIKKYGPAGKNGVIEITLKNNSANR